ncbi:MAG: sigma-70 family RNA polymerase sigma factor [Pirellulaceae bacterium]|nr:sigma-70 family RNA polymerase sigma factor [Pirellulaceae bacterium]HJN10456.1 sigma-70 family RNA polymerase sigma factor [Pirellulaceae bacterium]
MVDSGKSSEDARPRQTAAVRPSEVDDDGGLRIQQLVSDHYQSVYRYAYRLSGSAVDAEDLTQQAFLIAQQKLHQVREVEKVDRWLFVVLRSCFLKSHRRQRPTPAAAIELNVDEIPARISDAEDDVDQESLQAAIDDLPDNYRLVVMMFYFEQLSYKEIAAALDISIGTVMSRLSRAKGRIRQRLFRHTDAAPPTDQAAGSSAFMVI